MISEFLAPFGPVGPPGLARSDFQLNKERKKVDLIEADQKLEKRNREVREVHKVKEFRNILIL